MKLLLLSLISSLIVPALSWGAELTRVYICTDDNGKLIQMELKYLEKSDLWKHGQYAVEGWNLGSYTLNGQYVNGTAYVKVESTRDGYMYVRFPNYDRSGDDLFFEFGPNGSSYHFNEDSPIKLNCNMTEPGGKQNPPQRRL